MNKQQLKFTVLGAALGYLIYEYLAARPAAQDIRRQVNEDRINLAKVMWAKHMVDREVTRGRYKDRNVHEAVQQDFNYYLTIAPDPRDRR